MAMHKRKSPWQRRVCGKTLRPPEELGMQDLNKPVEIKTIMVEGDNGKKYKVKDFEINQNGDAIVNISEFSSPLDNTDEEIEACKARVAEGARCWCAEKCRCRKCQSTSKCTLEAHQVEGGCWACYKCSECKPCF